MIPIATTTVTVTRSSVSASDDPYDPSSTPSVTTVVSNLRATISTPTGSSKLSGGDRVVYTARLVCDPASIEVGDTVTDDNDGDAWTVLWVRTINHFSVSHMMAGLRLVEGAT